MQYFYLLIKFLPQARVIEIEFHSGSKETQTVHSHEILFNFRRFELVNKNDYVVCLKDIHLDNVRIFEQGVQKFVQLNLYTAL